MSATEAQDASVGTIDMKLEVQVIPVSDANRAKPFDHSTKGCSATCVIPTAT